ncbi:MAG: DUF5106 domain-containing protein [Tannerellaceae bacterium]|nr:DUF5106 domain-containing protein [Tannerellaceae bacterium]
MNCNGQQNRTVQNVEPEALTFKMVTIPEILTSPEERADYLVKHYWDHFDFTNPGYVHLPEVSEQAFVDYIDILAYVSPETASASIKGMLKKAEVNKEVFGYFSELYEKYLYDPNSPMRNEEVYIPVLEYLVYSSQLDDVYKIRPTHLLEVALRNRTGRPATDFTYTLANGRKQKLYEVKSDYTLLYFYNPDCSSCKELTGELKSSEVVNRMIQSGKLKIVAVYPDEDLTAWKNHLAEFPAEWINSYDQDVVLKEEEIYDLKAIPTIYLLDKDKNVVLKDTWFAQLEYVLQQLNQ